MLNYLQNQIEEFGAQAVAAAMLPVSAPLAVVALSAERGLLEPREVRQILSKVTPPILPPPPPVPKVPLSWRGPWLRAMSGELLSGQAREAQAVSVTRFINQDAEKRYERACEEARACGRELTYAASDWRLADALQAKYPEADVLTLDEALLTLCASSKSRLRALDRLRGRLLALDGLHLLDVRLMPYVSGLTHALSGLGYALHLSAAFPHPLHLNAGEGYDPVPFTAVQGQVIDHLKRPSAVMLPSRSATLEMQLLTGGQLISRSKTPQHLHEEEDAPSDLILGTPGITSLSVQRRICAGTTLPLLAQSCLFSTSVQWHQGAEFHLPNHLIRPLFFTGELLRQGWHPQNPETHMHYWDSLGNYLDDDPLGLMQTEQQLALKTLSHAVAHTLQSGLRVLVAQDHPEAVAKARKTGFLSREAPCALMTQSSVERAKQEGLIEEVGEALIWHGPYTKERGVGRP